MTLAQADAKCMAIQQQVIQNYRDGKPLNSFEPSKLPTRTVLDGGQLFLNDLRYATEYPNSFLDIWYPDEDTTKKRPTVVYFHGGGFIFGDKASGDPLAAGGQAELKLLREIVTRGYNLVNANYALAPEHRFPVQVRQVDQVMAFLLAHAVEYGLDMGRVVLSGGSAGADLTEIYGLAVADSSYAARLGFAPVLDENRLRALVINESSLNAKDYNEAMHTMLSCWLGEESEQFGEKTQLMNVTEQIRGAYIPAFINASNEDEFFVLEGRALDRVLTQYSIDHDFYYRDPSHGILPHGYMDMMEENTYAMEAFERMMAFIGKYV